MLNNRFTVLKEVNSDFKNIKCMGGKIKILYAVELKLLSN